ncbi:hypothetical protein ANCDUO_02495 [Ancylostoma duodenale]|uniref:Uncharacterized protein n=1 Tax=Ancylostoma duodenale TaxID=51022 RepID=A0A0C2H074_9BILA|nr:hypothetical protein ANCDUO_02495 [Ancylostoma duodenale]
MKRKACFFPESELRPFFYDVDSDVVPWTAIAESIVDPPDARILLASVRAENPVGINFTERFTLVSSPTGRFALHSVLPLTLPPQINRTKLFVTVVCNDEAFALFTVRVTSIDNGNPQFYNEPYYVDVNEGADSPFKIVTDGSNSSAAPVVKIGSKQTTTRQPTLVLLKLVKPIKHLPITLKLVAEKSEPLPLEHEEARRRDEERKSPAPTSPPSTEQSPDLSRSEIGEELPTVKGENLVETEVGRLSGGTSLEYSIEPSRRRLLDGGRIKQEHSPDLQPPVVGGEDTTPRERDFVENEQASRSTDEGSIPPLEGSTRMPIEDTTIQERDSEESKKERESTDVVPPSPHEHSSNVATEDTTAQEREPQRPKQDKVFTEDVTLPHDVGTEEDRESRDEISPPPEDSTTILGEDTTQKQEPAETEQSRGFTDGDSVPPSEGTTTTHVEDTTPEDRETVRAEQEGGSTDRVTSSPNEYSSTTGEENESLRTEQDGRSLNRIARPRHEELAGSSGQDRTSSRSESVEKNAIAREQEILGPEQDGESVDISTPSPRERSTAPSHSRAVEEPSIAEEEESPEDGPDDEFMARSSLPPTEHSTDRPRKVTKARTRTPPTVSAGPIDDSATRFDQCAISVSMPENSEVGSLVTTLNVLNRKKNPPDLGCLA